MGFGSLFQGPQVQTLLVMMNPFEQTILNTMSLDHGSLRQRSWLAHQKTEGDLGLQVVAPELCDRLDT